MSEVNSRRLPEVNINRNRDVAVFQVKSLIKIPKKTKQN